MRNMNRLPAVFFGHGNPMNALADNEYTRVWRRLGEEIGKPRAIVCVSAHWYTQDTAVTAVEQPRTIHDFGGFPRALYECSYPARGDVQLAHEVQDLLRPLDVKADSEWGLDHGSWSVLCHVYPDADVPVVQLSIDERLPAMEHYNIGRKLGALRERGVLLIGSGNLVHNLHTYAWGRQVAQPYDWAVRFETHAREWMERGEHAPLINYESLGRDAALSAPTPEHYLPLLYVLGAQQPGDAVSFPITGVDGGSVSMLSVRVG
jgi:4,5-DOPA dioxygenase extradiol